MKARGFWTLVCFSPDGREKWRIDRDENLIVNEGIDWIETNDLAGTTLYVGLTASAPTPAAGDTMSSHAGWTEVHSEYSESTRVEWVSDEPASKVVTNSTTADFSFTGTVTVGGSFITTDSTKNGTSGTLIAVEAFTEGDKAVDSGDSIKVTFSITGSSS